MRKFYDWPLKWLFALSLVAPFEGAAQGLMVDGATLTLDAGATLLVQGDVQVQGAAQVSNQGEIVLSGDLTNNSPTTQSMGQTLLNGSSSQALGGGQAMNFSTLTLNNAAGLIVAQDLLIQTSLELVSGNVDLNGRTVELAENANLIGENNANRVLGSSGRLRTARTLATLNAENIGNLGLELTTATNLGPTVIERTQQAQGIGSGGSIGRSFEVTPTNNTGLNATVRLYYLPAELNGQSAASLTLFRLSSGNWNNLGGNSNVAGAFVEQTGVNALGLMTLSADGTTTGLPTVANMALVMYPNPLLVGERLELRGLETGNYQFTLYDVRGRQLLQQALSVGTSGETVSLALPQLAEGMYTIRLVNPDFQPAMGKLLIH